MEPTEFHCAPHIDRRASEPLNEAIGALIAIVYTHTRVLGIEEVVRRANFGSQVLKCAWGGLGV